MTRTSNKQTTVRVRDLPHDFQVLLGQYCEQENLKMPETIRTHLVDVEPFAIEVKENNSKWHREAREKFKDDAKWRELYEDDEWPDERGEEYVADMVDVFRQKKSFKFPLSYLAVQLRS